MGQVPLQDGLLASIRDDPWVPGAFELVIDGTAQSHLDPAHPTELFFEYVRRIANVIDGLHPGPLKAVHLGAGALSIPRYIEATRPGSQQLVLELEPAVIDLVLARAPLPPAAAIEVIYGDARNNVRPLPDSYLGTTDVMIVDIFGGSSIPAHVTSREFYGDVASCLRQDGLLIVNVTDQGSLAFARGQVATVSAVCPHTILLAEPGVAQGRRFGNLVIVGGKTSRSAEWISQLTSGTPHPALALSGQDLIDWIADASVVTDDTAAPSPSSVRSIYQKIPPFGDEMTRGIVSILTQDQTVGPTRSDVVAILEFVRAPTLPDEGDLAEVTDASLQAIQSQNDEGTALITFVGRAMAGLNSRGGPEKPSHALRDRLNAFLFSYGFFVNDSGEMRRGRVRVKGDETEVILRSNAPSGRPRKAGTQDV